MNTPTVTEREAVARERAAFVAGCVCVIELRRAGHALPESFAEGEAARQYPLPKVTRPRRREWTNEFGDVIEFRAVYGMIEFRNTNGHGDWGRRSGSSWGDDAAMYAVWADLLANPTEPVDDDGSAP